MKAPSCWYDIVGVAGVLSKFEFVRDDPRFIEMVAQLKSKQDTELMGDKSFFLPFNKGFNDGAGNPPNPDGIKTDYLWKYILTKEEFSNILENYAQVIEEKDEDTGRKSYKQIFPRYHQLDLVQSLLRDSAKDGAGHRYLIQHMLLRRYSADNGKWLLHAIG